jgi:hypothetical protein
MQTQQANPDMATYSGYLKPDRCGSKLAARFSERNFMKCRSFSVVLTAAVLQFSSGQSSASGIGQPVAADIKHATKEKLQKLFTLAYGFTQEFRANYRANGARQFCAPFFLAKINFAQ